MSVEERLASARQARAAGDVQGTIARLQACVREERPHAGVFNMLGLALLDTRRAGEAAAAFDRAVALDPAALPLRINLADALQAMGDAPAALAALDAALEQDAYLLPALLRKGRVLETLGREEEALRVDRALLRVLPAGTQVPQAYAESVDRIRQRVTAADADRLVRLEQALAAGGVDPTAVGPRSRAYLENLAGKRKVFVQQPTGPHFPFLPAFEFFDDALLPWLRQLEAATADIRDEAAALLRANAPFAPYVQFDRTAPVNQWSALNQSPHWSALFLWQNGDRQEENIRRCPRTAAVMEALPLLDVPDKSPTVLFSLLAPHTHIPPHTGVTNTRVTVHLPVLVPPGCRFRVGGETREWVEGKAWAFDDTIEHEAWNDSDSPRVILILDAWNPLLTEDERAVVRLGAREMRLQ